MAALGAAKGSQYDLTVLLRRVCGHQTTRPTVLEVL